MKPATHAILIAVCPVLLLSLLLTGCEPKVKPAAETAERERPVWPEPPEEPRMAFVTTFSQPQDLGIGKTFMERLTELLTGPSEARLIRPMAVALATDGVIYVADPGAKGVHRFDTEVGRYRLIRRHGDGPLPSPVGLAAGPAGEVYVSDSQLSSLFMIEPGADEAVSMELEGLLDQPTGVAFDAASGRIYLVDTGSHQVKVFARDGALLSSFGRRGGGPGEFNFPTMIWRNNEGNLLVVDSLNFRIQVFDTTGRYLREFGEVGDGSGRHARPKGVASDRYGHIYVVDSLFHAMQIFDPFGTYLLQVGRQGRAWGEFWLPAGIFIDERDTIYVADSRNQRIQVFRYIGATP